MTKRQIMKRIEEFIFPDNPMHNPMIKFADLPKQTKLAIVSVLRKFVNGILDTMEEMAHK